MVFTYLFMCTKKSVRLSQIRDRGIAKHPLLQIRIAHAERERHTYSL